MEDDRVMWARVAAGLEAIEARLDDHREMTQAQHAENVQRLASIEREVRVTNGRVNSHDRKLDLHEEHISGLKRASSVWLNELVRYVAVIAGTWAVMKALGLLK